MKILHETTTLETRIRQRIECYITNQMSAQEREYFEADMDADSDFQKEVAAIYLEKIKRQKQSKLVNSQLIVIDTGYSKNNNFKNWLNVSSGL